MVVIVDAGIAANENSSYYNDAQEANALIKSTINPDFYEGALTAKVWPNHTVFLDFFNGEAANIWS